MGTVIRASATSSVMSRVTASSGTAWRRTARTRMKGGAEYVAAYLSLGAGRVCAPRFMQKPSVGLRLERHLAGMRRVYGTASRRRPESVLRLRRIQHRRHRDGSLFNRRQRSPRRGPLCAAIGKLREREARALWLDLSERVRLRRGDGEVRRAVAGAGFVVGIVVGVFVELVGIVVGVLVELVVVELLELGRIVFVRPRVCAVELVFPTYRAPSYRARARTGSAPGPARTAGGFRAALPVRAAARGARCGSTRGRASKALGAGREPRATRRPSRRAPGSCLRCRRR